MDLRGFGVLAVGVCLVLGGGLAFGVATGGGLGYSSERANASRS